MTDYIRKKKHPCPSCGYEMDAASPVNEKEEGAPIEGDFAICLSCGDILCFDKNLHFVLATQSDLERMDPQEYQQCIKYSARIKKIKPLQTFKK